MPPHSDCLSYTSVLDSWLQNKTATSLFCGRSLPSQPPIVCTNLADHSQSSQHDGSASPTVSASANATAKASSTYSSQATDALTSTTTKQQQKKTHRRSLQQPRRSVQFHEEVEIFEIPHVNDVPKSQLKDMHITKEEMAAIHTEAWEIVELMNLGIEYVEQDSFSKRGLVDLKDESVDRRKRIREQAYKIVFGIQAFGLQAVREDKVNGGKPKSMASDGNNGLGYSQQVMAMLYSQVSEMAQDVAHRVAMYDALAALE